ncbi:helix-turn-helix domain-containing protein [Alcanivorax hongdengensis A-11-3]|uniref:Helix-turn-helix domain-containing protein n=1 Tax=Alcanivorax hongdengensis A-11-3 TaxID=1177179 RepID=L0WGQ5_9GAMM|nr:AraC family transcriptional regulator [Alcanivorax hongdengensis]EKF76043.1 helix-turn-helix domain-containing protein [Alcanivorax hongdengensis A-11-3]
MTPASPYIPGHYLVQLMDSSLLPVATTDYLKQHLVKTGLDPLQLSEARLSPQSLEALLNAWPDIHPQRLAFEFGQQVTLTSQGNLSLLIMTAPTLREALGLYRFLPLLTNAVSLRFYETEESGHIQIQPHSGSAMLDSLLVLYGCAGLERLCTLLTGQTPPLRICVAKEYGVHDLAPALPENWQCDGVISSLTCPSNALDLPCQYADSLTHHRLLKELAGQLASQQQTVPLVSRIRQLLTEGRIAPNQESIARALNMSRSTLKRQLTREHTHFQAILTHFRKENAVRLLLGTTLSLDQIAEQLGYSDQTNFSHAFRQWSGMTPGQFRKHSR